MDDKDNELLKVSVEAWRIKVENDSKTAKITNPDGFEIKFADTFIDSFTKLLSKTDSELEREELERKVSLLKDLNRLSKTDFPITVYTSGYIYGEEVDFVEDFMKEEPEKYGFTALPDGKYTWQSVWTDVFIDLKCLGGDETRWLYMVQNTDSRDSHYECDLSINNELLQEAFREKDLGLIEYWNHEAIRLEDLHKGESITFTAMNLDTKEFITESLIIQSVKLWVEKFLPELSARPIIYQSKT